MVDNQFVPILEQMIALNDRLLIFLFQRGLFLNIGHAECKRRSMERRNRIHFHRFHLRRRRVRHVPPRQEAVDHGVHPPHHLRIRYAHSFLGCSGFLSQETQQPNAKESYAVSLIWRGCGIGMNYETRK